MNDYMKINDLVPRWKFKKANWFECLSLCDKHITLDLITDDFDISSGNIIEQFVEIHGKLLCECIK